MACGSLELPRRHLRLPALDPAPRHPRRGGTRRRLHAGRRRARRGLALAGVHAVWAVLLPQCLFAFGHGIHQPCGQAGAVGPFPRAAGAASALAGFVLALTAFGIGLWLGGRWTAPCCRYALGIGFWSAGHHAGGLDAGAAAHAVTAAGAVPGRAHGQRQDGGGAGLRARHGARAAGGDHQRRFGPGLPRHGHRHRQAQRRRARRGAAPPDRHPRPGAGLFRGALRGRRPAADPARSRSADTCRCWWAAPCCTSRRCARAWTPCPQADAGVRARIDAEAAARGWPALHAELARVDPATAARLAPADAQRIQRALEVWRLTGRPLSAWHRAGVAQRTAPRARCPWCRWSRHRGPGCTSASPSASTPCWPPACVDEVRALRARGDLHAGLPAMRCVGYRQAWEALETGRHRRPARPAVAATRQLAKRQLTWLRSMPSRRVVACDAPGATGRRRCTPCSTARLAS